jgi:hypothetical protein
MKNVFIKCLGETLILNTENEKIDREIILDFLHDNIMSTEDYSFNFTINGKNLSNQSIILQEITFINANIGLLGGKGGFGKNLKSNGNKLSRKKNSNVNACRDLSGRRIRHVNNDKILEEWDKNNNKKEEIKEEVKKDDSKIKEMISKETKELKKMEEEMASAFKKAIEKKKDQNKITKPNNTVEKKKKNLFLTEYDEEFDESEEKNEIVEEKNEIVLEKDK